MIRLRRKSFYKSEAEDMQDEYESAYLTCIIDEALPNEKAKGLSRLIKHDATLDALIDSILSGGAL
jgi:hypothetical protein